MPARVCRRIVAFVLALAAVGGGVRADDWPQWRGPNRAGVWNQAGILPAIPPGGLKVRWRATIGVGFSTPVIARGCVYVTDSQLVRPKARERIRAFDEISGRPLWIHADDADYPAWAYKEESLLGPRATPIVADGKLYSIGIYGQIDCLDARNGRVVWQRDLHKEYGGQRLECTSSPLIEGNLLIVMVGARPDSYDKQTGKKIWSALDESATFSSPVVIAAAQTRQLIVWTIQSITSLDPSTGKVHWRQPLNTSGDFVVPTPVCHGDKLLIGGLMMLLDAKKPGASVLWPRSRATSARLLSNTSTALFRDGFVYSARSSGEFVCLKATTGEEVWKTDKIGDLRQGASVHITPNGDSVLLFTHQGDLIRARLTADGYQERGRAHLIEPTAVFSGKKYAWAPPSYANGAIFVRNDKELVCASLRAEP